MHVSLSGYYCCSVFSNVLDALEPSPFINASLFLLSCYTNHRGTKTAVFPNTFFFFKIKQLFIFYPTALIPSPKDSNTNSWGTWLWTDSLSPSFSEVKSIFLSDFQSVFIGPDLPAFVLTQGKFYSAGSSVSHASWPLVNLPYFNTCHGHHSSLRSSPSPNIQAHSRPYINNASMRARN